MNKQGFTLVEVLTTVVIIAVLTSIALPQYARAIERSRATEAMSSIKAMNDSIYTYCTERECRPSENTCPHFNKLVARVAGSDNANHTEISTKFFKFTMTASTNVPGTDCPGVVATRINGGSYKYKIWNPYTRGTTGNELALQCAPETSTDTKSIAICESLGLYRDPSSN